MDVAIQWQTPRATPVLALVAVALLFAGGLAAVSLAGVLLGLAACLRC